MFPHSSFLKDETLILLKGIFVFVSVCSMAQFFRLELYLTLISALAPKMFDAFCYALQGRKCLLSLLLCFDINPTRVFLMSADVQ